MSAACVKLHFVFFLGDLLYSFLIQKAIKKLPTNKQLLPLVIQAVLPSQQLICEWRRI